MKENKRWLWISSSIYQYIVSSRSLELLHIIFASLSILNCCYSKYLHDLTDIIHPTFSMWNLYPLFPQKIYEIDEDKNTLDFHWSMINFVAAALLKQPPSPITAINCQLLIKGWTLKCAFLTYAEFWLTWFCLGIMSVTMMARFMSSIIM